MDINTQFANEADAADLLATQICLCGVCREMLYDGDPLADHEVYKCGELEYIELAHVACAVKDNAEKSSDPTSYWFRRNYWRIG